MLSGRLRPNEREVAAKVFDNEAILINLSSGVYYSMGDVGSLVWQMVEGDHSLEEIVAAVTARYDVSTDRARADVARLARELVQENLVVTSTAAPPARARADARPDRRLPYAAPTLNIYRDMGDLLAIDPPMPALDEIPWKEPSDGSSA